MMVDDRLKPHTHIVIYDGPEASHLHIMIENGGLRPHIYIVRENGSPKNNGRYLYFLTAVRNGLHHFIEIV